MTPIMTPIIQSFPNILGKVVWGKKEVPNPQVPGVFLPDNELFKLVQEAEKGPFMTLEEHHKKMNKWIQEYSRQYESSAEAGK